VGEPKRNPILATKSDVRDSSSTPFLTSVATIVPDHIAAFIQQCPYAVAMLDKDLKYVAVSDQWRKDYDLVGKSVLGHDHYEIHPQIPEESLFPHLQHLPHDQTAKS